MNYFFTVSSSAGENYSFIKTGFDWAQPDISAFKPDDVSENFQ